MGLANDIDLFGFSAGGSSVLYALTRHNVSVHAAMIVNTPPNLDSTIAALEKATGRKYVPSASSTQISDTADALKNAQAIASGKPLPSLLILQGADDAVVLPEGAQALEQALRPYYHAADRDSRLKLVVIPGMTHMWTQSPNEKIVLQLAAAWFNSQ
jgi:pimeloyl-ACP methyl ester carboxylesterase